MNGPRHGPHVSTKPGPGVHLGVVFEDAPVWLRLKGGIFEVQVFFVFAIVDL